MKAVLINRRCSICGLRLWLVAKGPFLFALCGRCDA